MKRLVFCFDGTWQKLTQRYPTNVVFTAESVVPFVKDNIGQAVFYDEGVGSGNAVGEHQLGGMFGAGMMKVLGDAYRFLMFNYEKGDQLFVFGFSRGAFTARSFVGLVSNCGVLDQRFAGESLDLIDRYEKREDTAAWKADMQAFMGAKCSRATVSADDDAWRRKNIDGYNAGNAPLLDVAYLGVWETVGALGVPSWMVISGWFDHRYHFHDLRLTSLVNAARHAVAIDEERLDYQPTLWENIDELNAARGAQTESPDAPYQQKWFPGGHGAVGGGGDRRGLSDQAMEWVWQGARAAGLVLDTTRGSRVYDLKPNPVEWLDNSSTPPDWSVGGIVTRLERREPRKGPARISDVSVSAQRRWQAPADMLNEKQLYRPPTLEGVAAALNALSPIDWTGGIKPGEPFVAYVVKQGDSLRALAKTYYGDPNQSERIYLANIALIADPDEIFVGQTLRIPGIAVG